MKFGTTDIQDLKLGTTPIVEVRRGTELIWPDILSGYTKYTYENATDLRELAEASRLITPNAFWENGVTYAAGQGVDSKNNAPVIFAWKNNSEAYQNNIGTSDNFDTLRHDWPAIWVLNGYVYVFVVDGHGYEINIYRSVTQGFPLNITDGFALHHSIPGKFGYIQLDYFDSEGVFQITSRVTDGTSPDEHTQLVLHSAANDFTSWTVTNTTTLYNSSYWHYPASLQHYESNEYKYTGLVERSQPDANYFTHAIYKTKDYQTFHSSDNSFKKNIISEGKFTKRELRNSLTVLNVGELNYCSGLIGAVVYDTIYTSYFNPTDSTWYLRKIDPAGAITDVATNFSDALSSPSVSQFNYIQIYYNGQNLVILTRFSVPKVYACDLNFGNLQFKKDLVYEDDTNSSGLIPHSFDQITGDYIIAGGSSGTINYLVTNEKFTIPISDPTAIEISNPSEADTMYAGEELTITVKLS